MSVPAIYEPVTETAGLGEAMAALNPQQRAFVLAYVETGGQDATKAAGMAGYCPDNPAARRVTAHRLTHDAKVLLAIKEVADKRVRAGAILGAEVIIEIAKDVTHKDRFGAAKELMNRAGLLVAQQVEHTHKVVDETDADRIRRVRHLAAELGMDPVRLLGSVGVVVDAEFEVVDTSAEPAPSSDGLEDLL